MLAVRKKKRLLDQFHISKLGHPNILYISNLWFKVLTPNEKPVFATVHMKMLNMSKTCNK